VWEQRDQLAAELGLPSGREMWLNFFESDAWNDAKTGVILHGEMWQRLLRPHGISDKESQEEFVRRLYAGEGMSPDMERLLAILAPRYKLGILSNWDDQLETILEEQLGIHEYFDVVINSHRIAAAKPDARAFQVALERLQSAPEEVLFIDDLERNVGAAADLGMHVHHFRGLPQLVRDLRLRSLLRHNDLADVA
jgi:HAD superfamily hydrolase (TIGR01509 family)